MAEGLKPPYLKKIGQRGRMSIWMVDGTYVRTHIDEEFTNYGQHFAFPNIPEDEFWLDKEGKPVRSRKAGSRSRPIGTDARRTNGGQARTLDYIVLLHNLQFESMELWKDVLTSSGHISQRRLT
jgi:hypothetical protein